VEVTISSNNLPLDNKSNVAGHGGRCYQTLREGVVLESKQLCGHEKCHIENILLLLQGKVVIVRFSEIDNKGTANRGREGDKSRI
jgi:hypothetical protein